MRTKSTTKGEASRLIKTTLHTYDLDIRKPEEAAAYETLRAQLKATPGRGRWMNSWGGKRDEYKLEPGPVELETDFLFENQWNTAGGFRVFDWFEEYPAVIPSWCKRGHYLDITQEMIDIRQNTLEDGWSRDKFPAGTTPPFNLKPEVLGGPFLTEDRLYLLRLLPVAASFSTDRPPLTEEEKALILPLYVKAQTSSRADRTQANIADIKATCAQKLRRAQLEHDGFMWFIDHGINVENCIFYDHAEKFSFGWRQKYEGKARETLLEMLSRCPFPYDVV